VVQWVVDPAMARQLSSTQPDIAIDGARATADIKVKNANDTRVTFTLQVLLTRSGTVVGVAQKDVVLEPGESQALSLPIEGVTEGAEAQTAIINVGD